jgi:hypothetical protein
MLPVVFIFRNRVLLSRLSFWVDGECKKLSLDLAALPLLFSFESVRETDDVWKKYSSSSSMESFVVS